MLCALLAGCVSGESALIVQLKTDLVPGREFVLVRVETSPTMDPDASIVEARSIELLVSRDDVYIQPARLATIPVPAGVTDLRVTLLDAEGAAVATRHQRVPVEGPTGTLVIITRSCIGIACPPVDEPLRTTCASGHCVNPSCTAESLHLCAIELCTRDGDCASDNECLEPLCQEGLCFFAPVDARCASTERCDPSVGCTAGTCGDGVCDSSEGACDCAADCGSTCGDGCCSGEENACGCPEDCTPSCGDGCCGTGEDSCGCAEDCTSSCGDGCCTLGENSCTCAADCASICGDGCCGGETSCQCPQDCGSVCGDGCCTGDENTCGCPQDCGAVCGDGCCNGGENTCGCPQDCGAVCGDGCCNGGEACTSCAGDCGGDACRCATRCCDGFLSNIITNSDAECVAASQCDGHLGTDRKRRGPGGASAPIIYARPDACPVCCAKCRSRSAAYEMVGVTSMCTEAAREWCSGSSRGGLENAFYGSCSPPP